MTNDSSDRKGVYLSRYESFKRRGHSFWPHVIAEDMVVGLGIFLLVLLAAIFLGTPLEDPADPTDTAYIPRPDWYFMFLFELLKLFPGRLEWIGVALLPALMVLALLLVPFYDRSSLRLPARRPLAMGVGTILLLLFLVPTYTSYRSTPGSFLSAQGAGPIALSIGSVRLESAGKPEPGQAAASSAEVQGKELFKSQGCGTCHSIGGQGGSAGPALDLVGNRLSESVLHNYIEAPSRVNPASQMPAFLGPLTHQQIDLVAQYLYSLRDKTKYSPTEPWSPGPGQLTPSTPQGQPAAGPEPTPAAGSQPTPTPQPRLQLVPQPPLSGLSIYAARCGSCHALPNPQDPSALTALPGMASMAGLKPEETEAVRQFLQAGR